MISLPAAALETLRRHVEASWPEEACGLLVGCGGPGNWQVERAAPADNVAENRRRRFEVDPRLRLRLQRELRGSPSRILGHYHSHPDGEAVPSDRDAADLHEPELVWLIAAVGRTGMTGLRAWRPRADGGGFDELTLVAG
jgi:proteasome lid subunit RPN8/RPN11